MYNPKQILLINEDRCKAGGIDLRGEVLKRYILRCQDEILTRLFGEKTMKLLYAMIDDGTIYDHENEKFRELLNDCEDLIIECVKSYAAREEGIKVRQGGTFTLKDNERQAVSLSDAVYVAHQYEEQANALMLAIRRKHRGTYPVCCFAIGEDMRVPYFKNSNW